MRAGTSPPNRCRIWRAVSFTCRALVWKKLTGKMSRSMRDTGSAARDTASGARRNRRAEATSVTASFVCADNIVAISTWKGSSRESSWIFSTASTFMPVLARAMTFRTARGWDRMR